MKQVYRILPTAYCNKHLTKLPVIEIVTSTQHVAKMFEWT